MAAEGRGVAHGGLLVCQTEVLGGEIARVAVVRVFAEAGEVARVEGELEPCVSARAFSMGIPRCFAKSMTWWWKTDSWLLFIIGVRLLFPKADWFA